MRNPSYRPGDRVVYRKSKRSSKPGPRAKLVVPSRYGEGYSYFVNKFWVVVDSNDDQVIVQTRRGKTHVLNASSRNLRRARWWHLLIYRHRFPSSAHPGMVG